MVKVSINMFKMWVLKISGMENIFCPGLKRRIMKG